MSNKNEITFPLSKKVRAEYIGKYELIALKKPVHNISDEKLVEYVHANADKLPNEDQKPKTEDPKTVENSNDVLKQSEGDQPKQNEGVQDASKDKADAERKHQFDLFKELNGVEANPELSTEEITAINVSKQNENHARQTYFGLFGKQPIEGMTVEQIVSANENEIERIKAIKSKSAEEPKPIQNGIDYDPKTEMIVQHEKTKEKIKINRGTFPFIKNEGWIEMSEIPNELQNLK